MTFKRQELASQVFAINKHKTRGSVVTNAEDQSSQILVISSILVTRTVTLIFAHHVLSAHLAILLQNQLIL